MMKILLISSRELCYFSGSFFLDCIQKELEKLCDVERVEFSETNLDALQACLDSDDYDAILDINSKLPYLILDVQEKVSVESVPIFLVTIFP